MINRIMTTVLAGVISLTSLGAAPVQAADRGEIARFILGAGALAIIANELNNGRNDHVVTRHTKPRYNNHYVKPRFRKVVPSACLRVNRYNHGPRRYFGQRCLQNNMRNAHRLPGYCTAKIRTKHGPRYVYAARCLRKNGWVFG